MTPRKTTPRTTPRTISPAVEPEAGTLTGAASAAPGTTPSCTRRNALTHLGLGGAAFLAGGVLHSAASSTAHAQETTPFDPGPPTMTPEMLGWDPKAERYVLPPLPYEYDALEPYIDAQTMQLHHDIHHAGYVRGLNAALDALAEIRTGDRPSSEVKHWSRQLAFNGSGHLLHVIFWNGMHPEGGRRPSGALADMINRDFGSYNNFRKQFTEAATAVEGSGWGLLVLEPTSRRLMVMQAEKHQNLTMWGVVPLVAVDVWEHAYYLKYQNRRGEYVSAFMNVIDWDVPARMLEGLMDALRQYGN